MPDVPDPPRKVYQLKPWAGSPVHRGPDDGSLPAEPETTHASPPTSRSPEAANDVRSLLQANHARASSDGLNEVAPMAPRRCRRQRDYWLMMLGGNLVLGVIALSAGPGMPMPFISALAGMAILSGGLTWVMWFVMDDY